MINFSQYNSLNSVINTFDSDFSLISKEGLERMFQKSEEGAIFIPKKDLKETFYSLYAKLYKSRNFMYPLAVVQENTKSRLFLSLKLPNESSGNFRNLLSDNYYELKNHSVLYWNVNSIKLLHDNKMSYFEESISTAIAQNIIQKFINKNIKICGIETPINSDIEYKYKANNLLKFPLLAEEFKIAKNWKNINA